MKSSWETAYAHMRASEGGYSNHVKDRGGKTNFGVTQTTYDSWRRRRRLPLRSVVMIEQAEVQNIAHDDYWAMVRADELPVGIDYAAFDCAYHHGPKAAVMLLQQAINATHRGPAISEDGDIGSVTIDRSDDVEAVKLINAMMDKRIDYMKTRDGWATFEAGWRKRVLDCRKNATAMALVAGQPATPAPKPLLPMAERPLNPAKDAAPANHGFAIAAGVILAALSSFITQLFGG